MPIPLAAPAVMTIGRYMVKNGAKKAIQKYGDDAVKAAMKENNLKTVGDKVLKKRMTVAEKKALSKKIQKEDFPKQKPTNQLTRQEEYLEELDALSRFDMKAGGLLSDDRAMYKNGGPGIEALRKEAPKVVERMGYEEGGLLDNQMIMAMEQPEMESDDDMEDNYLDFIIDEALSEEEEDMLMSKLEQDENLSMLFDKVLDVAQEFAGSGPVEGPGSGVSDSIPARLSDGEFVFTTKAVEEIGEDTLMSMMKEAEAAVDERQQLAMGGMPVMEEEMQKDQFGNSIESDIADDEIRKGMLSTNPRLK
jgi:hypothetical protein